METKTAVKCYTLDYTCDICKKGVMRPSNVMLTVYPPMFHHRCEACGYTKNFAEKYPRPLFEEIPQVVEEVHHDPTPMGKTLCEVLAMEPSQTAQQIADRVNAPRDERRLAQQKAIREWVGEQPPYYPEELLKKPQTSGEVVVTGGLPITVGPPAIPTQLTPEQELEAALDAAANYDPALTATQEPIKRKNPKRKKK